MTTTGKPNSDLDKDDHEKVDLEKKSAAAEPTPEPETTPENKTRAVQSSRRAVVVSAILAVLLIASAVLAGVLYFTQYRVDQQVGSAVQSEVLSAATDGAAAVLTYSPETLDADFANAQSRLTGEFLDYYSDFTEQVVAPAARDNAVQTTATVMGASVVDITDSSATVLAFIDQSTTSKDTPDPNMTSSSVRLELEKVDGKWLIAEFDPV